jgi:L-aminopeptidase/D-esterase-like protein
MHEERHWQLCHSRCPTGQLWPQLVVNNAFGDIYRERTGQIIAGTRLPSGQFFDMAAQLRGGIAVPEFNGGNTTLVVVATDATLSKSECRKAGRMAETAWRAD